MRTEENSIENKSPLDLAIRWVLVNHTGTEQCSQWPGKQRGQEVKDRQTPFYRLGQSMKEIQKLGRHRFTEQHFSFIHEYLLICSILGRLKGIIKRMESLSRCKSMESRPQDMLLALNGREAAFSVRRQGRNEANVGTKKLVGVGWGRF